MNFLRAHAATTRRLNADLLAGHGLTINDYEVLVHLANTPEHALKRVELVERLLLTPSGITRLLSGLESAGYVERLACETDGRAVYAKLTDAGLEKLRAAQETHLTGIQALFLDRFTEEERETLAELLARLPLEPVAGGAACATDDA
ncbi:MAG: MarR family transcriptional regulator [Actinobacteria bacterium]|nr:MarR family transcriptional regulator [Actinomycetota bacterium]